MSDNIEFEDTKRIVYTTYRTEMELAGGYYDVPYEAAEKIWTKAAAFVLKKRFDPIKFVKAQFLALKSEDRRDLKPTKLTPRTAAAVGVACTNYFQVAGTNNTVDNYRRVFEMLQGKLQSAERRLIPTHYPTVNDILLDPNLTYPAWFRVALAGTDQRVLDAYLELAIEEYKTDISLRGFINELGQLDIFNFRRELSQGVSETTPGPSTAL